MYDEIKKVIKLHKPDFIVFEQIQFQKNFSAFQQLAQLQGVIMAYLFERDIGFSLIEPTAWRSFVGIKGRKREEQKASSIQYIKDKYGIDVSEDIAEAICIGEWSINNIK